MNIKWYGHSCFLLTSEDGTSILTDPPAPETGYRVGHIHCDAELDFTFSTKLHGPPPKEPAVKPARRAKRTSPRT